MVETEVDHKIPFCYGGGNERGNIQLAMQPATATSEQQWTRETCCATWKIVT